MWGKGPSGVGSRLSWCGGRAKQHPPTPITRSGHSHTFPFPGDIDVHTHRHTQTHTQTHTHNQATRKGIPSSHSMSITGKSVPWYKIGLPGLGRGRMDGWGCMGAWVHGWGRVGCPMRWLMRRRQWGRGPQMTLEPGCEHGMCEGWIWHGSHVRDAHSDSHLGPALPPPPLSR